MFYLPKLFSIVTIIKVLVHVLLCIADNESTAVCCWCFVLLWSAAAVEKQILNHLTLDRSMDGVEIEKQMYSVP